MVSHVAADPASPDVLDLACSPMEPTFAAATAAQPGAHGAPNLSFVFPTTACHGGTCGAPKSVHLLMLRCVTIACGLGILLSQVAWNHADCRRNARDMPCRLSRAERAEGRLALWNLRAFKRVAAFSLAGDPALHCLAWARDGRTLLVAGADGCARLLDVASRAEVTQAVGPMGSNAWSLLVHACGL